MVAATSSSTRSLSEIATDINAYWPKPYFGAVPYIEAMSSLTSIHDHYFMDSAKSVVLYFLANATTWKGEHARRIKAELKSLAGVK